MTILTLPKSQIEKHLGPINEKMEEKISMFGTPIESTNNEEIEVEVFPNRPDLLSTQGWLRSFLQYLGKRSIPKFKINPPEDDYVVKVEKSVKKVRPYTVCAIIKNLKFDDNKIKEIIDIQEKLHITIGRKRKKIAIGVYPLEQIKLPIRFIAEQPDKIKFHPLESPKELTGAQILRQHPTGREYADLLKDCKTFPIFVDANNEVLSMPPIINSHKTGKIDENTKEVFIECSGFNLEYQKKVLNILVTALADMGGKIYSMKIQDSEKGRFTSPSLESEKLEFKTEDINKTLGLDLSEKEIKKLLLKMGISIEKSKDKTTALIPPYRADILHWIDLTEEVAIAYGYENFKPEVPEISTIGEEDPQAVKLRTVANILSGLGLLEVSSFHLTTKRDIKKMHHSLTNADLIEVEDSKTEHNTLRIDLLTNALKIFSENATSQYPQKIFELGKTFSHSNEDTKIKETQKLCIALIDEKTNFTDLKQILDYLMKMLNKEYKIEESEHHGFITGRTGKILINEKQIGIIGEVHPRVLKNWKLKMPAVALEIDLEDLF